MALDHNLMKELEASNWNENGSEFHVFNNQKELYYYLQRSKDGKWWRDEYGRFDFDQCVFNFKVFQWVQTFDDYACFTNAKFNEEVRFGGIKFQENVDFGGCEFLGHSDFSFCIFEKEFYPGSFNSSVCFSQAVFKSHVIFNVSFLGIANFSFSNFERGVDFEGSIFNQELKLHDSYFGGDAIFREVEFKGKVNSWNLSCENSIYFEWANFREKANFTEIEVKNGIANFHGANFEKNAYFYSSIIYKIDLRKSVIDKGVFYLDASIQHSNRETWRIIKHEFLKQNNRIEGLKYHAYEMEEYEKELFGDKTHLKFSILRFIRDFYLILKGRNKSDKFILFINRISNGYNIKPIRGIVFTSIATIVSYLLFIYTIKVENDIELYYSIKYLGVNLKQLLQMLNVTNWKYNPFGNNYNWAYGILFIGRIIIGFGIYQTVQAFRKYGRL
ncbi:hypothetical protein E9993_19950 [Labilibacter sediminis]|nr:hypothetical protein E9993_19950 [Labilibacter sediminis]